MRDDPRSFFGKLEFTTSSAGYCRVGRAALTSLRDWYRDSRGRCADEGSLPPSVLESLSFFRSVLPRLPARRFLFGRRRSRKKPIVVYTDAMYDPLADVPARIGIAYYDPELVGSAEAPTGWCHASASVPAHIMSSLAPRKQQIGPLETIVPPLLLSSHPERFRDREVILFVDNTQAVFNLASGSARAHDSARIVHIFHCMCAALNTQVWLEYVASGANIADQPSRDEFALLLEMGSTSFSSELRWPDIAPAWTGVFDRIFDAYAPKPSKAERAARRRVADEITAESARRVRARVS